MEKIRRQTAVSKKAALKRKSTKEKLRASDTCYRRLFETAQDGILILDGKTGKIIDANPFLLGMLDYSSREFIGKKLWEIGRLEDTEKSKAGFRELRIKGYIRYDDLPLETKQGRRINVEFVSNVFQIDRTKVIQCNVRDITPRKRIETEQENLIRDLKKVLSEIKTLSGLLLICAYCKKIRNDEGYWEQIEGYIKERSLVDFSHGICPDCMKKYYPNCSKL